MTPDAHADRVLILDFGAQYTQLIARRIRERGVYCEIHPCHTPIETVRAWRPAGIVLSGGPSSVLDDDAPFAPKELLDLGVPVLGICYGLQWMCQQLGGVVEKAEDREYGRAQLKLERRGDPLFAGLDDQAERSVWMSHGDRVLRLPEGFTVLASSDHSPFAAVRHREKPLYGVQFHPEVVHTDGGGVLLGNFVHAIAGCASSWTMQAFADAAIDAVRAQVGSGQAVCGLSGGVDSSVAAVLVHRAIGDRLHCILVDHGLMRENEAADVERAFREVGIPLRVVNASDRFLGALAGVTDPEKKRRIIGHLFIEVFEQEAARIGDANFLVQGTLYPDVIESVSVRGPSQTIKTHHNVGGLPERMKLALVEPLRELFKDEVRAVGRMLGIPEALVGRHPFPGPGLAIRIMGEVTRERLAILRRCDAIWIEELRRAGLYDAIWQAFAVFLPIQTVGVQGDARTYDHVVALRAVTSVDAMTADWAHVPHEVLARASSRITNEVKGVSRVVYDVSSKPPATIEWE